MACAQLPSRAGVDVIFVLHLVGVPHVAATLSAQKLRVGEVCVPFPAEILFPRGLRLYPSLHDLDRQAELPVDVADPPPLAAVRRGAAGAETVKTRAALGVDVEHRFLRVILAPV